MEEEGPRASQDSLLCNNGLSLLTSLPIGTAEALLADSEQRLGVSAVQDPPWTGSLGRLSLHACHGLADPS